MVWRAILAGVLATLLGRARAAPDVTQAQREMTLNAFDPMLKYSGTWFDLFPLNGSAPLGTINDDGFFFKYTSGGSLTFDFVGSVVTVFGYFGDQFAFGYFGENYGAFDTSLNEVRLRIDDNDYTTYFNSGKQGGLATRLISRTLPVGHHTVELTSMRGAINIEHVSLMVAMPVSQDDYADQQDVKYNLTTKEPFAMNTGYTTTGNWSAEMLPNVSDSWEPRHIKMTEVGASFSMSLGRGNDYVALNGNMGTSVEFAVEIDPAPYLTPALVELEVDSKYIIPEAQLYYAPLERDKNYTMKVTNKGGPGPLELISVVTSKGSAGWDPNKPSNTSADGEDGEDGEGAAISDDNQNQSKSGINTAAVAGGVVGGLVAAAGIAGAIFVYLRRKRQRDLEESQDNREKLDVDGDLGDNVTPFMRDSPHSPQYTQSSAYGQSGLAHGTMTIKERLPVDQPAPQTPQDTDAGPVTNDMIPPSYDPTWANAANAGASSASSSDFSNPHSGYEPHLSAMQEHDEPAAGSSSQPAQTPLWPQDRKDRRDF